SDTINVAGTVTADIQTKELEGASGALNHLVRSAGDPNYDLLPAPGIDYNVATPATGGVVITEVTPTNPATPDGITIVREGGPAVLDRYLVHLAAAPTGKVYVTISAACSTFDEARTGGDDFESTCLMTRDANSATPAEGDTILLASGSGTP